METALPAMESARQKSVSPSEAQRAYQHVGADLSDDVEGSSFEEEDADGNSIPETDWSSTLASETTHYHELIESEGWLIVFLTGVIYRSRYFIVLFSFICSAISAVYAIKLPDQVTPMDWSAPPGSPSEKAQGYFVEHYKGLMDSRQETVMIKCVTKCSTVAGIVTRNFVEEISNVVQRFGDDHPGALAQQQSYFTFGADLDPNPLLSHDKQALLYQWTWRVPVRLNVIAGEVANQVLEVIDKINTFQANGQYKVAVTGPTFMKRAMQDTLREELTVHDLSLMPFSFGLLAWCLKSFRLLLIPLLCIVMSLSFSFALTYFYALRFIVLSHCITMMMLLSVALTLDYSLFMLTRLSEERKAGSGMEEALAKTLSSSGEVVALSGTVLMVAYAAMLFLPGAIRSISFGAVSVILSSIVMQLVFVPALMGVCPWLSPIPGGADVTDVCESEATHLACSAEDPASARRFTVDDNEFRNRNTVRCNPHDEFSDYQGLALQRIEVVKEGNGNGHSEAPIKSNRELGASISGDNGHGDMEVLSRASRSCEVSSGTRGKKETRNHAAETMAKAKLHMTGFWFRLGRKLTAFPFNVVVPAALYLCMMPLTIRLSLYIPAHGLKMEQPRGSAPWLLANEITREFKGNVGCFFPVFIIMVLNTTELATDVRDQKFFQANCKMVDRVIQVSRAEPYALTPDNFLSVTFHDPSPAITQTAPTSEDAPQQHITCDSYWISQWFRSSWFTRGMTTAQLSQTLWDTLVSERHDAVLTILYPNVDDVFGNQAFSMIEDLRATLAAQTTGSAEEWGQERGLTFMTHSATGLLMDNLNETMSRLPIAFVCTVVVSFVFIAIAFRALIIPVQLFFTIILPITWVYGAALLVYEDGVLGWTGLGGVEAVGGVVWLSPVYTLTIILGLALDYTIFLYARVREYRLDGFGDREAIQLGLASTGPIITMAGAIFAITFSSMCLSSIPIINQIGFLFIVAVMVDTLIVNLVISPASLSLVPWLNYWPMKMPEPSYVWLRSGD